MVTMRRKITQEKDRYGSFDSIIEVDDVKSKSYNANQFDTAEAVHYSPRRPIETATKKKSGETMPQIKSEKKERIVEAIGLKTKMLLVTYVAVAIILAAVVIGTGVAITRASNRASDLEAAVGSQTQIIQEQDRTIFALSDENTITGRAVNDLDMEKITDYAEIELVELAEPMEYSRSMSLFDRIARFFASLFA